MRVLIAGGGIAAVGRREPDFAPRERQRPGTGHPVRGRIAVRFAKSATPAPTPKRWATLFAVPLLALVGEAVAHAAVTRPDDPPAVVDPPNRVATAFQGDPFVRPRPSPVLTRSAPLDARPPLDRASHSVTTLRFADSALAGELRVRLLSELDRMIEDAGLDYGGLACSVGPGDLAARCEPSPPLRSMCGMAILGDDVLDLGTTRIEERWISGGGQIWLTELDDAGEEVGCIQDVPIEAWSSHRFDGASVLWIDHDSHDVRVAAFPAPLGGCPAQFPASRLLATLERQGSLGHECPLGVDGERTAIVVGDELVLVGQGSTWDVVRPGFDRTTYEAGTWSCGDGELRRVERSTSGDAFRSFVCSERSCGASVMPAGVELATARSADAMHLGAAVVVLLVDAAGSLRVTASGGGTFAASQPVVARDEAIEVVRGDGPTFAVRHGVGYVSVRDTSGPGLLRLDASGRAEFVDFTL